MRIFALSDIHIDYDVNAKWISDLSALDYRDDVLILAGDVTDSLKLLEWCLSTLVARFRRVAFVPGNHELWVTRYDGDRTSLQKFDDVLKVAAACGVSTQSFVEREVAIVPLFGWYDWSFGEPGDDLRLAWVDFRACRWPAGFQPRDVAAHFDQINVTIVASEAEDIITFSHFLPRIDVMPSFIPNEKRMIYPVLGTTLIEKQLRRLGSQMHIYGHSHVNRKVAIDGVTYINNAFGYPQETRIAKKELLCIHETGAA
jgi:predicted phosphodiesterase